ncbi:MAG: PEP-CTERM sorting domain-containing protein [Lacipirellulaceae bacterium]
MAVGLAALLSPAIRSDALVVKTWNGPGTPVGINQTAPADDPGWHNTSTNRSAIYLGDQWVLTAKHAGVSDIVLPSGAYSVVPNSVVTLKNPTTPFAGQTLSTDSDLIMYRINTHSTTGLSPESMDPNIRQVSIATTSPTVGRDVLMIGSGNERALNTTDANGQWHWNVQSGGLVGGPSVGAQEHGYFVGSPRTTWGTNRVANASQVSGAVTSGNNVLVRFGGNGFNDVIGLAVQFDRGLSDNDTPIADGSTPDEAQGVGGDSGGPVFFRDGSNQWVLGGVMHAIYLKSFQPAFLTLFETQTVFTDLSIPEYGNQIAALRASNNYSVLGDVNLDGVAQGGIVGDAATGDLGILVQNWGYTQTAGDVVSWKRGDLNQDGRVGLADYALMRQSLGGMVSETAMAALLAGLAIPEPSTALLLLCAAAGVGGRRRR